MSIKVIRNPDDNLVDDENGDTVSDISVESMTECFSYKAPDSNGTDAQGPTIFNSSSNTRLFNPDIVQKTNKHTDNTSGSNAENLTGTQSDVRTTIGTGTQSGENVNDCNSTSVFLNGERIRSFRDKKSGHEYVKTAITVFNDTSETCTVEKITNGYICTIESTFWCFPICKSYEFIVV